MSIEDFFTAPARHQALYDTIAASHPSLLAGIVWCGRCGTSRHVEAARCLRGLAEVLQRDDGTGACGGEAMKPLARVLDRDRNGGSDFADCDRLCACGHRLGNHLAERPHACLARCGCEEFIPTDAFANATRTRQ